MKLGLISDIHGNLPALSKVLEELRQHQVKMILCAGDLVGLGAHPNRVIDTLNSHDIPSVLGNYDAAVGWDRLLTIDRLANSKNESLLQTALTWTKQHVNGSNRRYLRALPLSMRFRFKESTLSVMHTGGNPADEWQYPKNATDLQELAIRHASDIVVLGHTHQQLAAEVTRPKGLTSLVINPGSVGFPLDRDNRAAYAVLNLAQRQVEMFRTAYDVGVTMRTILSSGMPTEIADLLFFATPRLEDVPRRTDLLWS